MSVNSLVIDIIGPSILTVDLITQIFPGLSNQNESLRWQAMNSMCGLAQLGKPCSIFSYLLSNLDIAKVRESVLFKVLIQGLRSITERDPNLREATVKVESFIAKYGTRLQEHNIP
jgi:hypothetical protein